MRLLQESQKADRVGGTPEFMAPEVWSGIYGARWDDGMMGWAVERWTGEELWRVVKWWQQAFRTKMAWNLGGPFHFKNMEHHCKLFQFGNRPQVRSWWENSHVPKAQLFNIDFLRWIMITIINTDISVVSFLMHPFGFVLGTPLCCCSFHWLRSAMRLLVHWHDALLSPGDSSQCLGLANYAGCRL